MDIFNIYDSMKKNESDKVVISSRVEYSDIETIYQYFFENGSYISNSEVVRLSIKFLAGYIRANKDSFDELGD